MQLLAGAALLLLCIAHGTAAPAAAPATSLTPGSLAAAARSPPAGTAVCTFDVRGGPASSNAPAASRPASSNAAAASTSTALSAVGPGLTRASISCSGGSRNVTIQGGPALETYSQAWRGVTYIKNIQLPGSTMTLRGENMVVQDSFFGGLQAFGSGAIVFAASNVTFINTTFTLNNNSAAGCIYANESSSIEVLDSNFTNNAGLAAGNIALWNSTLWVNNTMFSNNTCNAQGGAIMVYNGTDMRIMFSNFTMNNATNGGAIYLEVCSSVVVEQNIFSGNTAGKSGGAFFQLQCPGSFQANSFLRNYATNGGAIWHNNMRRLNHTLNLFVNNVGTKGSGGIELNQVDAIAVTGCNFTGGYGQKGGAIYTQNCGGDITDTYFARNNVTLSGGAVFRGTSSGNIRSCTFLNNSATSDGGAIYDSHVSGDIMGNRFTLPVSRNNSITGIFRTVSSGDVSNNTGLPEAQFSNQQPATTG